MNSELQKLNNEMTIALEKYKEAEENFLEQLFDDYIKEVCDRRGWMVSWSMGSVSFKRDDGKDIAANSAILKRLDGRVSKVLEESAMLSSEFTSSNSSLWIVCCNKMSSGAYRKDMGVFKT